MAMWPLYAGFMLLVALGAATTGILFELAFPWCSYVCSKQCARTWRACVVPLFEGVIADTERLTERLQANQRWIEELPDRCELR